MHRPRYLHCLALSLLLDAFLCRPVDAQNVIDLGGVELCRNCALRPELVASLGNESGRGMIEESHAEVRYDEGSGTYAVFHIGGTHISLFDKNGTFVRTVGGKGGGPGEIQGLMDAALRSRDIVLIDFGRQRLTVLDRAGATESDARLTLRPGQFQLVSDTLLVIGSIDRAPATVGYPLHLLSLPAGRAVRHFGSVDGQWSAAQPFAQKVIVGASPVSDRIWIGNPSAVQFEQWDINGKLLRRIDGQFDWFPPQRRGERGAWPPTLVTAFGTDAADRLWIVVQVPDGRWRDVPRQGAEGYIRPEDMDRLLDTRIDVFDLRRRRHLGTLKWDEANVGLVQKGGSLALQRVVYDADMIPRVAVYDVKFGSP